jgi:glycosyltransferase involved in cell wall biosynthesis
VAIENQTLLIIHVAWIPKTGVWALMKNLAAWQSKQPNIETRFALFASNVTQEHLFYRDFRALGITGTVFRCRETFFLQLVALCDNRLQHYIESEAQHIPSRKIIVHIHNAHFSAVFLPLHPVGGIVPRVIVTYHGCPTGLIRRKPTNMYIHRWLARRLAAYDVQHVSVTHSEIPMICEALGYSEKMFSTVYNGVPYSMFVSEAQFKKKAGCLTIGFVGSLERRKRWWLVGEATELARASDIDCRFLIAGSGELEEQVKLWASTRSDFCAYLGEVQDAGTTLIPRLDVLVLPSENEGMPMTIIEAFAAGVPVICTDVGGIPEMVVNGHNGFLVAPNANAIAERLTALTHDLKLRVSMGENARATFLRKFCIDACGLEYLKLA